MIHRLIPAVLALAATSMACSIFLGGPAAPESAGQDSPDGAESLQTTLERAISDGLTSGTISVSISQQQLTEFIAARLSGQVNPTITDPRVVLADGELTLFGRAQMGFLEANTAVTADFVVDETGMPKFRIGHAEVGPFQMPQALKDAIAATVDETLTGYLGPVATGFRLESIEIHDGSMTVTGRLR